MYVTLQRWGNRQGIRIPNAPLDTHPDCAKMIGGELVQEKDGKAKTNGVILCDQAQLLDLTSCHASFEERASADLTAEAVDMIVGFLEIREIDDMDAIEKRNKKVRQILGELYQKALDVGVQIDESAYKESLDKLFNTTAWGFREILLVVIIGMRLDRAFRASTGLYNCNPRAIYEGPIKEFLIEKDIPHRKSGPLNVAKATVGLDMTWAAQRRPSDVAEEVVHLVDFMESDHNKSEERATAIGVSLLRRLIAYSDSLAALAVEVKPSEDPNFLYYLCHELITKAPDAGNTPQKIAAFLLKCYHTSFHTGIEVTGGEDRASVTSTTSKKPGDINEEYAGQIYKVYEITVKHFDIARIRDSFDCISIYNQMHETEINEIIVICRREDCPPDMETSGLHGYLGHYIYQNIIYYYWDIYEWIANTLQRMTTDGRKAFYLMLNKYINDTNTAETVKKLWRRLHDKT